jgi:hypothetical protein
MPSDCVKSLGPQPFLRKAGFYQKGSRHFPGKS